MFVVHEYEKSTYHDFNNDWMRLHLYIFYPFHVHYQQFGRGFNATSDLRRYVARDELVGVWSHNSYTEKIIARYKPSGTRPLKCHLTLYSDGTCDFDSVYGSYDSFAYRKSTGRWILEHDTEGNSNVSKKNAIAFDMEAKGFTGNMYLNIKEEKGKLILWEWYGDPDSWEFIEYVKEE